MKKRETMGLYNIIDNEFDYCCKKITLKEEIAQGYHIVSKESHDKQVNISQIANSKILFRIIVLASNDGNIDKVNCVILGR